MLEQHRQRDAEDDGGNRNSEQLAPPTRARRSNVSSAQAMGRGEVECRVVREDRSLEPLEFWSGFQAEFADECTPRVLVELERLRLKAGPVERDHELLAQ